MAPCIKIYGFPAQEQNIFSVFSTYEKKEDFQQEVSVVIYNPNSFGSKHKIQSNVHLQSPI